jgi:energy-coupling factor transporter transmembrane protein EcfT
MRPRADVGPLSLLACCLLPVLGATAIHGTRHGLVCLAVLVAVSLPLVDDWGPELRRAAFGLVAAASLGVSTWLYGGRDLDASFGAVLRICYLIWPGAVLTSAIEPSRLGDHLAQRLHLPARPVVAATAALERLDSLGEQWQQIARARRARGVGADGSLWRRTRALASMTLALLVSSLRRTGAMALAMDARGFATSHRRTWAQEAPWQVRDSLALLLAVGLAALPWLLRLPALSETLALR